MKIKILTVLLAICNIAFSQENTIKWAYKVQAFDQRYFLNIREDQSPEPIFKGSIRPGILFGIEKNISKKPRKSKRYLGFELQAFKYKYIDFGGSVLAEIGRRRTLFNKFLIGASIGLGAQFAWKDDKYQKYENNKWQTYKEYGKMNYRTVIQPRGHLGWKLGPKTDLLLNYRLQITTPFYKPADIQLMLSKGIEVGIRRKF